MTDTPLTHIAGFRLVRKLGEGERSEVFLALPLALSGADDTDIAPASTPAPRTAVAIKLFRALVSDESVAAELEVLGRARSISVDSPAAARHVVGLKDVAGDGGRPAAILQRIGHGSLAALLRERDRLEVGEAVTILAPIAQAVDALHHAGIAHGALSAASIHFGDAGEPVVLGFGHARTFDRGLADAALDSHPDAAADRQRLAAMASLVLERVDSSAATPSVDAVLRWLHEGTRGSTRSGSRLSSTPLVSPGVGFASDLQDRLFACGPAAPIEFSRPALREPATLPARQVSRQAMSRASRQPPRQVTGAHRRGPETTEGGGERSTQLVGRVRGALREVRIGVWMMAGVVATALVAALVVVPQLGTPAAPQRPAVSGESPAPQDTAPGSSDNGDPVGPIAQPEGTALSDDPVVAIAQLLAARERCFADLSLLCLDDVDHRESAAMAEDRATITALVEGESAPEIVRLSADGAELIERRGGSALVRIAIAAAGEAAGDSTANVPVNAEPASALMIRTETGWRIREIFLEQS